MLLILCVSMLVGACLNNRFVVGTLYNRIDNQMRKAFHKLTRFDDEQITMLDARVLAFHNWHREAELPRYAALADEVGAHLVDDTVSDTLVQRWFDTLDTFSQNVRACYPANFSTPVFQSLDQAQLADIRARLERRLQRSRNRYRNETPEDRVARRVARMNTWSRRIDLELRPDQLEMLREMFRNQNALTLKYYALYEVWLSRMFRLAAAPVTAENTAALDRQMASLWGMLERQYPDEWQTNRELWETTLHKLFESFDSEQRTAFGTWLGRFANNLRRVSRNGPERAQDYDAALGCMP
ncbi:MAG: hypothetical protein CSB44_06195 [Gammaproteobacteria bacterium]|nr:MAG: hypothetical protein CSB44_06195 [Gammaproteobacteria bacterium]